jgi:hypothetical protein
MIWTCVVLDITLQTNTNGNQYICVNDTSAIQGAFCPVLQFEHVCCSGQSRDTVTCWEHQTPMILTSKLSV